MTKNTISQIGAANLAFADIHDSAFNIFIGKNHQYRELVDQLGLLETLLSRTPAEEGKERIAISQKITEQKQLIDQFKLDVLQLAEQFSRVQVNADRLRVAKELFSQGEFEEARKRLEAEVKQIQDEQIQLLVKRDQYFADVLPKLKTNAEELFILGLLTELDHSDPQWFPAACNYFELSIRSHPNKENVFHYAVFAWRHNKVMEAEKYYQMCLSDFAAEMPLADRAAVLNNLGLLHWDSNEYEKGLRECEEAFEIYKGLSRGSTWLHLAARAATVNNIAMLRNELGATEKALAEYAEVLKAYEKLERRHPHKYLLNIAMTLSNLGSMNVGKKRYKTSLRQLKKALAILKGLSDEGRGDYPFYKATALHNLGMAHSAVLNYEEAVEAYESALTIRMEAAKDNPSVYLPEASCTLANLASLYAHALKDREKSIMYALKTLEVLGPIYMQVPFTQQYLRIAVTVLKGWNISNEEIERLLDHRPNSAVTGSAT